MLTVTDPVRLGMHGAVVHEIQEWLGIQGFKVGLDGDFGPATEAAIRLFQTSKGLPATGEVDQVTATLLDAPLLRAITMRDSAGRSLSDMVVLYAKQHLAEHPVEVGGDNCGPFVRLYCQGNDGGAYAWCAGFATYVVDQAVRSMNPPVPAPYEYSLGCTQLAQFAAKKGLLVKQPLAVADKARVVPGSLFLVPKPGLPGQYHHTGIVTGWQGPGVILTIEGNTNSDGSRNGYAAMARIRNAANLDYIVLP